MKISGEMGELLFEGNGDIYESCFLDGTQRVSLEITCDAEEAEEVLKSACDKLPGLLQAAKRGIAADRADAAQEYGVAMYLEHLLTNADSNRMRAILGAPPTTDLLFALVHPYSVQVEPEEGLYCSMDFGVGHDLADYLISVTLDSSGRVQDVVVES